jgi:hypothetical protein
MWRPDVVEARIECDVPPLRQNHEFEQGIGHAPRQTAPPPG